MNNTIDDIAEQGNMYFDRTEYAQAVSVWQKGLDMLAKPLNAQSEAVWFQTSIADAYFMLGLSQRVQLSYRCKNEPLGRGLQPFRDAAPRAVLP